MSPRQPQGARPPTPGGAPRNRDQAVLELLEKAPSWQPFYGPSGALLWRVPGSAGAIYTVGPDSCTCPYQQYGHQIACKHRIALAIYMRVAKAHRAHLKQLDLSITQKETPHVG